MHQNLKKELRMLAWLAWNNWPDNAMSRAELEKAEQRDAFSAAAWDRVVGVIWERFQNAATPDT